MYNTIIFDLGAVLIDWNPRYLYKKLISDDAEIEDFLGNVCTSEWNEEQDAGRLISEGTKTLLENHPQHAENIKAFYNRWEEMLGEPILGTVNLFKQLKENEAYKIYALTNWSAETFPIAQKRFEFLNWFDGIAVSGIEKMRKPAPEFFQLLIDRYSLRVEQCVFIDDNLRNVLAAREFGIYSIHYISPEDLKDKLQALDLI